MILSHVTFIKSSNAWSLNLRSIHFVLLHDNRVTVRRRVFLTCHSIHNTNRERDYIKHLFDRAHLLFQAYITHIWCVRPAARRRFTRTLLRVDKCKPHNLRQFSTEQIKNEGKIVRILLNLLRCCIKQINECFYSCNGKNIFIFHLMNIFLPNI